MFVVSPETVDNKRNIMQPYMIFKAFAMVTYPKVQITSLVKLDYLRFLNVQFFKVLCTDLCTVPCGMRINNSKQDQRNVLSKTIKCGPFCLVFDTHIFYT